MYPFSHSVTPAIRSHLDAQAAFFNDMTKSLSRSFQSMCELNMQLGQTLMEEGNIASHQMLTTDNPTDAMAVTAARAQPAADKLRAYQQHISRVVADAQIDLADVAQQHSPLTSRTARNLADQVAKVASEETEKNHQKQKEVMENFRDPFQQNTASGRTGNGSAHAHGSMQSAEPTSSGNSRADADNHRTPPFQGSEQGVHSTQPSGVKK